MCGGSVLWRARWGSQPALRLSAPLSPAVRRGDVEGLIALIDTFPSYPTLGRPSLIPPFILLPLPRCGPVLLLAPVALEPRLGEKWGGQGLHQAVLRSPAGISRKTVLCELIFLNIRASPVDFLAPVLFQGTAEMSG